MSESLWGDEFIPQETQKKTQKILDKIKEPKEIKKVIKTSTKSKSKIDVKEQLRLIEEEVNRILGVYKENTIVIQSKDELHDYISAAIANNVIAIDTETNNSLDPITCKLMGPCIYTPGQKNAYIPVNHIDIDTRERLPWQVTEADIKNEFLRLKNVDIIMHNGKFDYQVIKCTCDLALHITWDTMIGAKVLDENERSAGLKQQYIEKIDPSIEKYSIEDLFSNIDYELVPPELFALYAATDAYMTYKLYLYQKAIFETKGNEKLYNMFNTLEMPLVQVIAEMELAGMEVDMQYADLLSKKFHKRLDAVDNEISQELCKLSDTIKSWRATPEANSKPAKKTGDGLGKSKNEQLEDPINLASPTQLAILFYDVLKCPVVSKKSPRGTGEAELKAISDELKLPICDLILKRREIVKLLTTYIDVIPELAKRWPDGRVRTHFNAYGAATGRLSSSDPLNFQNIPSHEKTIRMLFKAKECEFTVPVVDNAIVLNRFDKIYSKDTWLYADKLNINDELVNSSLGDYSFIIDNVIYEGANIIVMFKDDCQANASFRCKKEYRIIGGDYSAQEPRLTAFYSQDENMIKAYVEGKDLYSVIASMSFDRTYEDCLEFYPEGTEIMHDGQKVVCGYKTHQNKEGKTYRTMAKSILLGVLYGRGAASVGEQIGKTREEAQEIIDKFFKAFPKVQKWINGSIDSAHKLGYVEDVAGRRRRLPDILLPKYIIKDNNKNQSSTFNPFLVCENKEEESKLVSIYRDKLSKIRNRKDYEFIQKDALTKNIEIHDNTGFIAQAERQAVNSRVQGGAASLTKNALLSIFNDNRLKAIGAHLINTVHDEILIEAPEEYSKEAEKLLSENMVESAKRFISNVPMKTDTYNVNCWYVDEYFVLVENEFKKLLDKGLKPIEAFEQECLDRCESTRSQIYEIVKGYMDGCIPENVDTTYKSL